MSATHGLAKSITIGSDEYIGRTSWTVSEDGQMVDDTGHNGQIEPTKATIISLKTTISASVRGWNGTRPSVGTTGAVTLKAVKRSGNAAGDAVSLSFANAMVQKSELAWGDDGIPALNLTLLVLAAEA